MPHRSLRPSKSLGQNFLVNEGVVSRIIEELAPTSDETIIEIGPGRGALTSQLLEKAGLVVAVEFDRNLIPLLQEPLLRVRTSNCSLPTRSLSISAP